MARCNICCSDVVMQTYNGRADERCPVCKSLRRHRDNMYALHASGAYNMIKNTPLLMVSLDPYRRKLERKFKVTVLIKQPGIPKTVYGDICKPPFKPKSFGVVIASHVLEHIQHDDQAVAAIFELLAPCGIFISNVPCDDNNTVEFGAPDPKQHGHWRLYGFADYAQLLRNAGFKMVTRARRTAFSARRPKA